MNSFHLTQINGFQINGFQSKLEIRSSDLVVTNCSQQIVFIKLEIRTKHM
ncbi:hypothetical protein Syun_020880 [Stephania yunnanensis]|uniref:Uncharacterized protein n=1 Tax=Stephania yunnanensis TaxID=152371 RepID=A0AAP0NPA3_9MAGN